MGSYRADHMERITMIESISAVTLATHNMPQFYRVLRRLFVTTLSYWRIPALRADREAGAQRAR
jgi:hypothetical protein